MAKHRKEPSKTKPTGPLTKKGVIEGLEEERKAELHTRKTLYDQDIKGAARGSGEPKKRLHQIRRSESKHTGVREVREWALVNAEALKEFIKYGSNKVLDQIRIRNQAAVIAREEIAKIKKKEGFDSKQAVITLAVMAIIAVMVYVVVINFMDFSTVTKALTAEKIKVGDVSGKLAACESELAAYKPNRPRTITPQPPPDSGGGQVLEG